MIGTPPVAERPPLRPNGLVRRAAPLVLAGGIGAGIAVGLVAAIGVGADRTTIVREVPASAQVAVSSPATDSVAPAGGDLSTQEIYRRTAPAVVRITSVPQGAGGDSPAPGSGAAMGSGFVIDKAGHIVTNYHVVESGTAIYVQFSSDETVKAELVGADPSTDIAVLRVTEHSKALTPVQIGESDSVEVGDRAVAIGNPFGLDRTVTEGIVSALQRDITAPNGFTIDHVIQTDAAINHGNSGGPLLDGAGRVIGVNAQIQSGGVDGNVGIGFAIPIDTVKEVVGQIIRSGKVDHAYLGVSMNPIEPGVAKSLGLPVDQGVIVAAVQDGSPAAAAGLRGGNRTVTVNGTDYVVGGDIVVAIDGRPVSTVEDLRDSVLGKKPGDTIRLEVYRDGEKLTLSVQLGRRPDTPTG